MASPVVVDLSHHNPTPNWAMLKGGGVIGVIHKATEGTSYVDPTLFTRARDAMDAGLKWSTYHFMKSTSDVRDQMEHYLDTVNPVSGERVCLDHEDSGVSLDELKDAVAWIRERRPDLQITIYSGHVIKEQLGDSCDEYLGANTSLWIAQYTTDAAPDWPQATWPQWSLWQYTDRASIPGVSQPVDGNKWNGTEEALIEWFGPAEELPPEPQPEPEELVVTVIAPAGVRVVVQTEAVDVQVGTGKSSTWRAEKA